MKRKLIFVFIFIIICIILGVLLYYLGEIMEEKLKIEKPTEQYVKMKELSDSQTLIGLPKEDVKKILGEPAKIYTYDKYGEDSYMYNAGYIYDGLFYSKRHNYVLYINFEETGRVESTRIKERP